MVKAVIKSSFMYLTLPEPFCQFKITMTVLTRLPINVYKLMYNERNNTIDNKISKFRKFFKD